MKMKKCYSNDDLKESLKDSKAVIKGLTDFDLDDDELLLVNKFKNLSQFERDLLYLSSQHKISFVADLYNVSSSHIYNLLNEIRKKLKS